MMPGFTRKTVGSFSFCSVYVVTCTVKNSLPTPYLVNTPSKFSLLHHNRSSFKSSLYCHLSRGMSASTMSITAANPTAGPVRRKPAGFSENTTPSNIELLPNDVGADRSNCAVVGDVGNERVISNGNAKDLSHHSVRREAVLLDRSSKEMVNVKKNMGNPNVTRRRNPKVLSKPPKPKWATVLSVFAKNFVLLNVIVGLIQLIRTLTLQSGEDAVASAGVTSQMGHTQLEGQIHEANSLLKKTSKMLLMQIETIDRKNGNQIDGLRKEVNKKIEDNGAVLETGLEKLETRSEVLEKSVEELKAAQSLWKEEFDKVYENLKKAEGREDGVASLDEIRLFARDIVEKEIEKHAADGLGKVDFALASGGASVVKHSVPLTVKGTNWFTIASRNGVHPDANKMLTPSFGEPGQCFALKGSNGFVLIKLRTAVIPEAVTLEHVAKNVAYDRTRAPKGCRLSGWWQGHDVNSEVTPEKMFLLAEFTYDLDKSNAQTFNVLNSAGSGVVNTVRLDFTSNHGSPSHTCIYRLRVHGHETDSVSMIARQS